MNNVEHTRTWDLERFKGAQTGIYVDRPAGLGGGTQCWERSELRSSGAGQELKIRARTAVRVVLLVFSMMCLMCSLTVCSVMPSAFAISLFVCPLAREPTTSCSRAVRWNRSRAFSGERSLRWVTSSMRMRIRARWASPPSGNPKARRSTGGFGVSTKRVIWTCSQSFASILTRSAVMTSAHSSVTAGGSTPVAAFPFSACVIFLLSSQARRFMCISFSAGESSRIPGPTRCSTSSSRKSNEMGGSSVNNVVSILDSIVPPLQVFVPCKASTWTLSSPISPLVLRHKPIRREVHCDTHYPLARLDPHDSSLAQDAKRYLRKALFEQQDHADLLTERKHVLRLVKHPGGADVSREPAPGFRLLGLLGQHDIHGEHDPDAGSLPSLCNASPILLVHQSPPLPARIHG